MNLPMYGNNQLPIAGFDWIALKVIFQGQKGLNLQLFSNFDIFCLFIQNLFRNIFLCWHEAFPDGDNELWREGFDWVTLNVIVKGQKGQVWLIFTYFSIFICSPEVLPKCIASCSFSEVILVLFLNINGVDWFQRVIFKFRKIKFRPLLSI